MAKDIQKPKDIADDSAMNAVWNAVVLKDRFTEEDVPTLRLLCRWHKVFAECVNDLAAVDSFTTEDSYHNVKAMPQLAVMKQASAEIRALNDQLGLSPKSRAGIPQAETDQPKSSNAKLLKMVFADREEKERKAVGK